MTKKRIICAFSLHPYNCRRQQYLNTLWWVTSLTIVRTQILLRLCWTDINIEYFTQNNTLIFIESMFNAQMSMTTDQSQTRNKVFRSFAFFLFSKWQIIRRIIAHFYLHLYFLQPIGTILINKIWQLSGHILLACHAEKFKQ